MESPAGLRVDWAGVALVGISIAFFLLPVFVIFPPIPVEKTDVLNQTHSRAGILHDAKKKKQGGSKPAAASPAAPARPTVRSLFIYPIKSCRGIEISRSKVNATGLENDRLYCFAQLKGRSRAGAGDSRGEKQVQLQLQQQQQEEEEEWEVITQRQFPRLATLSVELWLPDSAKKSRQLGPTRESFIILRFPWKETGFSGLVSWLVAKVSRGLGGVPEKEVLLPVDFPSKGEIADCGYGFEDLKIWRDTVPALNMERDLPPELRLYLGVRNRLGLFRMSPDAAREVYRCAPSKDVAGYQPSVGFQDAYPVNLINMESLDALQKEIPTGKDAPKLDVWRFRPNITVCGVPEYEEETWKTIQLRSKSSSGPDASFFVTSRTVRCTVPNVDQESGVRHASEPDQTLRKHRNVDAGYPKGGCLGMQLCPKFGKVDSEDDMRLWIESGMEIEVQERGQHVYIPMNA